jgi:hypothetical protein
MACKIRSLLLPFAAAWEGSPSPVVSMQRTWFKVKFLMLLIKPDVDLTEEEEDSDPLHGSPLPQPLESSDPSESGAS